MSTLAEIEAAADALPNEQKEQLLTFLAAKLGWTLDGIGAGTSSFVRRAGLHAGVWEVAQDFDASMLRCRMSAGSIATREAPLGYARVHLVGRRPVKAICRSSGCVPVDGE
jgi:hypothetical protein